MAITDSFTNTNGTAITAHGNWVYTSGSGVELQIQSNALRSSANGVFAIAQRTETFAQEHYAEVVAGTVTPGQPSGVAISCQGDGTGDCVIFGGDDEESFLASITNGEFDEVLLNIGGAISPGDVLRLTRSGNTYTPTINGSTSGAPSAGNTTSFPGGGPGVFAINDSGASSTSTVDDFECPDAAGGSVELVVQDALHASTVDSPSLTQANTLVVADSRHDHSVDSPELTQAHVLVVSDSLHAQSADSVALTQAISLIVAESTHSQSVDAVALVQAHLLAVQDALHAQAADNVSLQQGLVISVEEALHDHAADNVALVQAHILSVDDSTHAHTVESIEISQSTLLEVADALHSHAVDAVELSSGQILAVASALHLHSTDDIDLTQANVLVVSDALHAHMVDALDLRLPSEDAGRHVFVIRGESGAFLIARETTVFRVH